MPYIVTVIDKTDKRRLTVDLFCHKVADLNGAVVIGGVFGAEGAMVGVGPKVHEAANGRADDWFEAAYFNDDHVLSFDSDQFIVASQEYED